jgi:hypothetical protein
MPLQKLAQGPLHGNLVLKIQHQVTPACHDIVNKYFLSPFIRVNILLTG